MWWYCCKQSDVSCRHLFDETFNKIINFVLTHSTFNNVPKKEATINWLMQLRDKKEQWAACYTWSKCTLGIHSTVRAEAINSVIASFCKKTDDMGTLIMQLERMVDEQQMKSEFEMLRVQFSSTIAPIGGSLIHPFAEKMCVKVTPYAASIIRAQAAKAMQYGVKQHNIPDADNALSQFHQSLGDDALIIGSLTQSLDDRDDLIPLWKLRMDYGLNDGGMKYHVSSWKDCSCQFYTCMQLPCRHMFSCMILQSDKVRLDDLVIGSHWLIDQPTSAFSGMISISATAAQQTAELRTLEGRRQSLTAACSQMIEIASSSIGSTKRCLKYIKNFVSEGAIKNKSKEGKTNVMDAVDSRKDEDSDEYDMAISSLGIGNPPLCKSQHQRRKLPTNPAAPTTKGYKRASQISTKEKREQKKKEKSQSLGLIA